MPDACGLAGDPSTTDGGISCEHEQMGCAVATLSVSGDLFRRSGSQNSSEPRTPGCRYVGWSPGEGAPKWSLFSRDFVGVLVKRPLI